MNRVMTVASVTPLVVAQLGGCQHSVAPPVAVEVVWASGGPTGALSLADSRAYAMVGGRLMVADMSRPDQPRRLGESVAISDTQDLAVVGSRAYAVGRDGLTIMDVSEPDRPVPLRRVPLPGHAVLAQHGGLVLLEWGEGAGLAFVDLQQPDAPRVVDRYEADGAVLGMAPWRDGLLTAVEGLGVQWLQPPPPAGSGGPQTVLREPSVADVAVSGDRLYVAGERDGRVGVIVADLAEADVVNELGFVPVAQGVDAPPRFLGAVGDRAFLLVDPAPLSPPGRAVFGPVDPGPALRIVEAPGEDPPRELAAPRSIRRATDVAADGAHLVWLDDAGLHVQRPDDLGPDGVVGQVWTVGHPVAIAVEEDRVYEVVDSHDSPRAGGLRIVDTSDPAGPVVLDAAQTGAWFRDLTVSEGLARCVARPDDHGLDDGAVWTAAIRDRRSIESSRWDYPLATGSASGLTSVATWRNRSYVIHGENGLQSLDAILRPPLAEQIKAERNGRAPATEWPTPTPDRVVETTADYLVTVAENPRGSLAERMGRRWRLRVLRPQGGGAPLELGRSGAFAGARGATPRLAVAGDRAYVAGEDPLGLRVFDLADPARPRELGHLSIEGMPTDIAASGDYVMVATSGYSAAGPPRPLLRVVDVHDPLHPQLAGEIGGCAAVDLAAHGGLFYGACGLGGLQALVVRPVGTGALPTE